MINKKIAFIVGVVTVLLTGFFAFVNLNEWYTIAIMKQTGDYHFGSEGPSPYYYRSSSLYGTVTFIWGAAFLANLMYVIWSMLKDRSRATVIGFSISVILFCVMFIHGQISTE